MCAGFYFVLLKIFTFGLRQPKTIYRAQNYGLHVPFAKTLGLKSTNIHGKTLNFEVLRALFEGYCTGSILYYVIRDYRNF